MSAPAAVRSSAIGSASTGRARRSASRTAVALRIQPWSSIPEPRPTTATGSLPVSAAISTDAGVLLATPRSPGISRSAPPSTSASAIRTPAATAARASASVSASSRSIEPEPRRTLNSPIERIAEASVSTAMSTTRTLAPAAAARTLIAAAPVSMLPTSCAVTSAG